MLFKLTYPCSYADLTQSLFPQHTPFNRSFGISTLWNAAQKIATHYTAGSKGGLFYFDKDWKQSPHIASDSIVAALAENGDQLLVVHLVKGTPTLSIVSPNVGVLSSTQLPKHTPSGVGYGFNAVCAFNDAIVIGQNCEKDGKSVFGPLIQLKNGIFSSVGERIACSVLAVMEFDSNLFVGTDCGDTEHLLLKRDGASWHSMLRNDVFRYLLPEDISGVSCTALATDGVEIYFAVAYTTSGISRISPTDVGLCNSSIVSSVFCLDGDKNLSLLGKGLTQVISHMAFHGDSLYVAGKSSRQGQSCLMRFDDGEWLQGPVCEGIVSGLTVVPNPKQRYSPHVTISGQFRVPGSEAVIPVAQWTDQGLTPLGGYAPEKYYLQTPLGFWGVGEATDGVIWTKPKNPPRSIDG